MGYWVMFLIGIAIGACAMYYFKAKVQAELAAVKEYATVLEGDLARLRAKAVADYDAMKSKL